MDVCPIRSGSTEIKIHFYLFVRERKQTFRSFGKKGRPSKGATSRGATQLCHVQWHRLHEQHPTIPID